MLFYESSAANLSSVPGENAYVTAITSWSLDQNKRFVDGHNYYINY